VFSFSRPEMDLTLCFTGSVALSDSGVGFWALINTNTAEQFGTNLRANGLRHCPPNLIRASLIPISACFNFLKEGLGLIPTAVIVGSFCVLVSIVSTLYLEEPFGKDLDYDEV